jgi:hypothetical protein
LNVRVHPVGPGGADHRPWPVRMIAHLLAYLPLKKP